ncbi:MAG: hypothetical protein L6Q81_05840 [Bacteroidia bacterium]|nr:hypothetical protein [Bacteroidia bacterium]
MAAETQYTANTGCVTISTANSNLDGTGTLGTVLTAASNGTLVKSIIVKAQTNTTQGMIRLFVTGGGATELISEIEVPAITKSSVDPSFEIYLEINYALKSGYVLKAATQNAETFNVIAEGLDWAYYTTSVRPDSTKFIANTGMTIVSTANSNLDGSGTLSTVLTPDSSKKGCNIQSVNIKATVNTTPGMIRLFIYNGTTNYLFSEIPVGAVTKSGTAVSYSARKVFGGNDYALKATYLLKASTQVAESFNVIAEGLDWEYPA